MLRGFEGGGNRPPPLDSPLIVFARYCKFRGGTIFSRAAPKTILFLEEGREAQKLCVVLNGKHFIAYCKHFWHLSAYLFSRLRLGALMTTPLTWREPN